MDRDKKLEKKTELNSEEKEETMKKEREARKAQMQEDYFLSIIQEKEQEMERETKTKDKNKREQVDEEYEL